MVVFFRESPGYEIFVLDSEQHEVLPATKRSDLIGIYVCNNDGTFYLIKDDGVTERLNRDRPLIPEQAPASSIEKKIE